MSSNTPTRALAARQPSPDDPAAQLRWLVDRAAISDLLLDFARCLDVKDWVGYVANFTPDATLTLPGVGDLDGRAAIEAVATHGLDAFDGTWHASTNHQIVIDGDTATSRSYLQVAHVPDAGDPTRHGDAGGWYECAFRRTPEGWRFTSVALDVVWTQGTDLPGAR